MALCNYVPPTYLRPGIRICLQNCLGWVAPFRDAVSSNTFCDRSRASSPHHRMACSRTDPIERYSRMGGASRRTKGDRRCRSRLGVIGFHASAIARSPVGVWQHVLSHRSIHPGAIALIDRVRRSCSNDRFRARSSGRSNSASTRVIIHSKNVRRVPVKRQFLDRTIFTRIG